MKSFKIALLFSLYFTLSITAQSDKAKELNNYINMLLKENPIIPGVSVVVVTKDGVQLAEGFGKANVSKNVSADGNTNFYIASVTKSFNGLLAHILANEGVIDLNKQITGYKPFKDFKKKAIFKNTTIQDLLSHQIPILENSLLTTKLAYLGNHTNEDILDIIEHGTTRRKNGKKKFRYSNFGYYLFGVLLQEELGESWKNLLAEKIFTPLNMINTTAYISKVDNNLLALPYSTFTKDSILEAMPKKTDETMHAAGGIVSNAKDMASLLSFYINDGHVNGTQIYPKTVIQNTITKQAKAKHDFAKIFNGTGYASGWRLGKYNEEDVVYHFGGYIGTYAHLSFLPEQKVGVSIIVNHDYGQHFSNLIVTKAYNLYTNKNVSSESFQELFEKGLDDWAIFGGNVKRLKHFNWDLSLPKTTYAGTYDNSELGEIIITYKNGNFLIKLGRLETIAYAHSEKNAMIAQLYRDNGFLNLVKFTIENGDVKSLSYNQKVFIKK